MEKTIKGSYRATESRAGMGKTKSENEVVNLRYHIS